MDQPTPTPDEVGHVNHKGTSDVLVQDIVQFDNDAVTQIETVEKPMPMYRELSHVMLDQLDHSIKSFLSRPFMYTTGTFTSTNTVNTELVSVFLYSDLMSLPYYAEKLHGVTGFRATTHFRVQCNANRFQQGRLMSTFFPGSTTSSIHNEISQSMVRRSQLPRVELDINLHNESTLVVPYVNEKPYYFFSSPSTSFLGHFALSVYSPLLSGSGGENSCNFSIWIHFTDVELFWPGSIAPQSAIKGRLKKRLVEEEVPPKDRPISTALNKISGAFSAISGIPFLSSYAQPIAWATGLGSKAAFALGYCKPQSNSKDVVVYRSTQGWANGTGRNFSENLGLFEDNKVTVLTDIGGSGVDQMSLQYVLRIPTFFSSFSWSTTTAPGYDLYNSQTNPSWFAVAGPTSVVIPTPLFYFSKMFTYYRGNVTFRVKAVKTEFHTGRIRVVITNSTISDPNFHISKIIDLKESSEWTFDVPFTSNSVYETCYLPTTNTSIHFYVLNELRCPETVAQNVNFIVEVCGGEDFEFANPITPKQLAPLVGPSGLGLYPTSNTGCATWTGYNTFVFDAQGVEDDGDVEEISHTIQGSYPLANVPAAKPTLDPSLLCIGERVTSLKQLATRPGYHSTTLLSAFIYCADIIGCNYTPGFTITSNNYYTPIGATTYLDMIRMCYAFHRGSICVKATQPGPNGLLASMATGRYNWGLNGTVGTPSTTNLGCVNLCRQIGTNNSTNSATFAIYSAPNAIQYTNDNQLALDVLMPNYNTLPVRRNCWLVDNPVTAPGQYVHSVPHARMLIVNSRSVNNTGTGNAYRQANPTELFISGGDDFQCGMFIGVPFMSNMLFSSVVGTDSNNNLQTQTSPIVV